MSTIFQQCLAQGAGVSGCGVKKPPYNAAILAPFVKLKMVASGTEITVGNKSAPQNGHHAVIKDFEMAQAERPVCRIKIVDEQGSSFVKFMETLQKNLKCITQNNTSFVEIQWGWIKTSCANKVLMDKSEIYVLRLVAITCQSDNGKCVYELELADNMDSHAETRYDKILGQDGADGMYLTDAIRTLLTDQEYPPSVARVDFIKLNESGNGFVPIEWADHDGDPTKGPKFRWSAENRDKLNTINTWLSQTLSKNKKSFKIYYDAVFEGGRIIITEDPLPGCTEIVTDSDCIGLYIVNGGKDSPVISFSPTFKWVFTQLASAGGSAGDKAVTGNEEGQSKQAGHDCPSLSRENLPSGGIQNTMGASQLTFEKHSKDRANTKIMEAQNKHLKAFRASGMSAISADLVVVGDPSLGKSSLQFKEKPIHIVQINPFHLYPRQDGNQCGEWLAAPFCNDVLTNKRWRVESVNHRISEGKYTTTINVRLDAPGIDLEVGEPLGGAGSGGWTPPTDC